MSRAQIYSLKINWFACNARQLSLASVITAHLIGCDVDKRTCKLSAIKSYTHGGVGQSAHGLFGLLATPGTLGVVVQSDDVRQCGHLLEIVLRDVGQIVLGVHLRKQFPGVKIWAPGADWRVARPQASNEGKNKSALSMAKRMTHAQRQV